MKKTHDKPNPEADMSMRERTRRAAFWKLDQLEQDPDALRWRQSRDRL